MVDGSNLIKDGDKLATYHYQITEFIILINGEQEKIPTERIFEWKVEHLFEQGSFPIFKLNVAIEPSQYYKILKNKKDVKFKIRAQTYYTINDNPGEKSMLRDYINDTFVFFPDDDNSDFVEGAKTEESKKDKNELDKINNYIELFLFKDFVTKMKSSCNYVFTNITACTAVTYLLYKNGAKKVLMSPFENTETYPQLVLPPQSVEDNIKYLNNNFGFHRKGSIIYYGLMHNYILNCKEGCTAWYKKEWKDSIIYVLDKGNTKTSQDGPFIRPKEEKYYTLIQAESVNIENSNVASNVITGVNPTVVDMKNNSTSTNSAGARDIASENQNIVFNDTSNKFMPEVAAYQRKSTNVVITAMVDNINIEAFNPNKKHTIIFENTEHNQKYGGTYRISTAIYTFQHSSGDFTVHAVLTFKKAA